MMSGTALARSFSELGSRMPPPGNGGGTRFAGLQIFLQLPVIFLLVWVHRLGGAMLIWRLGETIGVGKMQTKLAADAALSPYEYARLTQRSERKMPTALGKPAWRCSSGELRKLQAWHLEVAALFERMKHGVRAGIDYQLSAEEREMIERHQAHQQALWRWALGIKSAAS
jgi:hypothetical protein